MLVRNLKRVGIGLLVAASIIETLFLESLLLGSALESALWQHWLELGLTRQQLQLPVPPFQLTHTILHRRPTMLLPEGQPSNHIHR